MPIPDIHEDQTQPPARRMIGSRKTMALAAAGLLILGGAAGAAVIAHTRPSVSMAPATPTAIRSLSSGGIVTIRGRVAEIYGNKVIVSDASGRALVDFGREGESGQLVTAGEPVTVQGEFDRGFIHASYLVGPDNKVIALGPFGGPPHGHHGPRDNRGHDGPPPPGYDPDADAPPPPAAANPSVAPAPATASK
jgi:uncharacterized protein YdeI (BOF family)